MLDKWSSERNRGVVFASAEERNLIASFFQRTKGIFVEVGAFHPIFQSQTYHLEIMGWDGVLIEPVPAQAENLRRSRRAQVIEVACVGPGAPDSVPLLLRHGLSTLNFQRRRYAPTQVIQVAAKTLSDVLANAGLDRVDFLSVDVEGSEPDVLRGFDFTRYKPMLVLVDDRERFSETRRWLASNGYKLVRRTGNNTWFVPQSMHFPVGALGRARLKWAYTFGRLSHRMRTRILERSRRMA